MNLLPPAVEKTMNEGGCRICNARDVETAHLWPKGRGGQRDYSDPDAYVPLCKAHHGQFDRHELELLPFLTPAEQVALVREAGSLMRALHRVTVSF